MEITTIKPTDRYTKAFSSWQGGKVPAGYIEGEVREEDVAFYRENGFLVVQNLLSPAELEELKEETLKICRNEEGLVRVAEGIGGEDAKTDQEIMARYLCIHFPHKISAVMRKYLDRPKMVQALTQLIGPNVKCMQSMLFIKAAGKPGQAWHQDEHFIPTRDRSLTGGWMAMDDATVENGCLWAIPGSHKRGVVFPNRRHEDRRFDCAGESYGYGFSEMDEVPLEMKAGSMVFFNGYLLHRSLPNKAKGGFRRSLVNHYMSAESTLPWIQAEEEPKKYIGQVDFRDIVMIAGEDPYAWKGISDHSRPHVRPSGEGGCGDGKHNVKDKDRS